MQKWLSISSLNKPPFCYVTIQMGLSWLSHLSCFRYLKWLQYLKWELGLKLKLVNYNLVLLQVAFISRWYLIIQDLSTWVAWISRLMSCSHKSIEEEATLIIYIFFVGWGWLETFPVLLFFFFFTLLVIYFKYSSMYMSIPNSLTTPHPHPSPPNNHNFIF